MPQSGHLKDEKFGPFDVNQLFAQIRMAISITDPQGRMVAWNDNLVGYLGEHQEGAVIFDRIASDMDRRRLIDLAEKACSANAPVANQILQLRDIDGQERIFSVAASCLSQGDMRYLLWEISPIEVEVATFPNMITIKEKEADLTHALQYQREVFNNITEGLVVGGIDGAIYDINHAFAEIIGYDEKELLEPNFGWTQITPPELLAQDQLYIEHALAGEAVRYEKEYIHKSGRRIPVAISYRKLERQQGWNCDRLIATVTDITEIKERDLELTRINAALGTVSTNVMVADPQGIIIHENPSNHAFWSALEDKIRAILPNFRADGIVGSNIDIYHKNPAHQHEILERIARDGSDFRTIISVIGYELQVRVRAFFDTKNDLQGYVAEIVDFTAEQEKEAVIDGFMAAVFEGMLVYDMTGRVYVPNQRYADLLGYTVAEMTAPGFNWARDIFHIEDLSSAAGLVDDPLLKSGTVQRIEGMVVYHRNGRAIPVVMGLKLLPRRGNWDQDRYVATIFDLTEYKEKEAELAQLLETQRSAVEIIGARLAQLAAGDLITTAPEGLQGEMAQLGGDLGEALKWTRKALTEVQHAAQETRHRLGDLESGNRNLRQRTQSQAASIEETSAAMEELTASVTESATLADVTAVRAQEMKVFAEEGARLIYAAEEKIHTVAETGKAIGDIISVVDEIAFTTNLLALNATIEAAHAGEHGRGFAVVAQEVRRLAQSSAANSREIRNLINQTVELMSEGSALSGKSAQSFALILKGIDEASQRVNEIAQAAESQKSAAEQVASAVADINTLTQENSTLAQENSTAFAALSDQTVHLTETVEFFTLR